MNVILFKHQKEHEHIKQNTRKIKKWYKEIYYFKKQINVHEHINKKIRKRGIWIMKFGALYSYWGHEWKCDYIETAKRMHACGCEVLEVGAPHLLEMTDDQLKELKTTCDELEMEITSNIGPSKEYDLASEDTAVRANGVKYLTDILRAMKKIGSKSMVGAMYS